MTEKEASKIINKILKAGSVEAGIFISLLSYYYLQNYDLTEEKFFESLKNSINKLKEDDNNDEI